jgi:predicted acetyltransferase
MAVSIRDAKGSPEDRKWIRSVYRDYLDDLTLLNTGIFPVLGEFGHREPDLLARWFADDRSHPLLILKSEPARKLELDYKSEQPEQPVGFALVVRPTVMLQAKDSASTIPDYHMSEFFVLRPWRRLGIGRNAATLIFNRFAGQWEVTEYLRNANSVRFWRQVINAYTSGHYTERVVDGEVRQRFRSHRRLKEVAPRAD